MRISGLARAAVGAGVDLSVACSVVLERRLLLELLPEAGCRVDWLNHRAEQARATKELSAPSAAYLRALTSGSEPVSRAIVSGAPILVALPARLSDRLLAAWPPTPDLEAAELAPALLWERAAVLAGLTLTEWGLREVLRR